MKPGCDGHGLTYMNTYWVNNVCSFIKSKLSLYSKNTTFTKYILQKYSISDTSYDCHSFESLSKFSLGVFGTEILVMLSCIRFNAKFWEICHTYVSELRVEAANICVLNIVSLIAKKQPCFFCHFSSSNVTFLLFILSECPADIRYSWAGRRDSHSIRRCSANYTCVCHSRYTFHCNFGKCCDAFYDSVYVCV